MEEKKYYLTVGEHTYEATRGYVNKCIEIAKDALKKTSKNAIVALEKDNVVIMAKETFIGATSLNKAVADYISKGFKVHKIRR